MCVVLLFVGCVGIASCVDGRFSRLYCVSFLFMNNPIVSLTCGDGSECHVVIHGDHISNWIEAFRRLLAFQQFDSQLIAAYLGDE